MGPSTVPRARVGGTVGGSAEGGGIKPGSSSRLPSGLSKCPRPRAKSEEKFEVHKIVLPERILEKDCAQIGVPREDFQVLPRSASRIVHRSLRCQCWSVLQQRIAEQFEGAPQHPEETVEMARSVSHGRVQQRAAEQVEDAPQFPAEVVEAVGVTGG